MVLKKQVHVEWNGDLDLHFCVLAGIQVLLFKCKSVILEAMGKSEFLVENQ